MCHKQSPLSTEAETPPRDGRNAPPVPPGQSLLSGVRELVSGVDALYFSGRATIPNDLIARLEKVRQKAIDAHSPQGFTFGVLGVEMLPRGWGKYRYCFEHPYALFGVTQSSRLPSVRVQPRAEFLHGAGPEGTVEWVRTVLESELGPVLLTVGRVDLFTDLQGWDVSVDRRHEFTCRARSVHGYETDGAFNGLVFGDRKSHSIMARIYDKTVEIQSHGAHYWPMIWGDSYDPELPVVRVEFEIDRAALREYGLATPSEVLEAVGALWASLTDTWLVHRVPTSDQTRSRWPVTPAWEAVRRARIADEAHGIRRMYLGKTRGGVEGILPNLVGYLASFGAYTGAKDLKEVLPFLDFQLSRREAETGLSLEERISARRKKLGLP